MNLCSECTGSYAVDKVALAPLEGMLGSWRLRCSVWDAEGLKLHSGIFEQIGKPLVFRDAAAGVKCMNVLFCSLHDPMIDRI